MDQKYLIKMKPMKAMILLSLPIMIGHLFQQIYTMVDSAVVGRFVGQQALAAVGASYSLTNIFICVAIGGGVGASVPVSRFFGAGNYPKMRTAINTALLSFLGISVLLGGGGLVFCRPILQLLKTPPDVIGPACRYLNIYFAGLPFLFMYNIVSSLFNALGRSRIPLFFLVFSSLLNIVLDLWMVAQLRMGVIGAALATLIAQGVSAVASYLVFVRIVRSLSKEREKVFDKTEFASMARIALPSILQQSTVAIGMMMVQAVVNGFGSRALAGYSAAMRINAIATALMGISPAVSAFTAQNIGAGRKERVAEGYRASNCLVGLAALIICLSLEFFAEPIIGFFMGENASSVAMSVGVGYLRFQGFFFGLLGFKMNVDGVLRGAGDMKAFTVANLVNLSIRVILAYTLAPTLGIAWVWLPEPLGWLANWSISYARYRTGKWKDKVINTLKTEEE